MRTAMTRVFGGVLLLSVSSSPALAEDAGDHSGPLSALGTLFSDATYSAQTVMSVFPRNSHNANSSGIEDSALESWNHLGMDSKTFLGQSWAFDLGLEAVVSSYRGEERGAFSPPSSRSGHGHYVDISRLSLSYLGDDVEFLLGKDGLPVGVAELYSPSDLYGAQNIANPQQKVDYGVWQLRSDIYVGGDQLTAVLLPIQEASPGPAEHSRWSGGGNSSTAEFSSIDIPGLPTGLTADIQDDLRGSAPRDWGYFLQYKGTGTGIDYYATAFNGPSPYPVLKSPHPGNLNPYYKVYPRVTISSAGLAVTEGGWKLYGEGVTTWAAGDRDEDTGRVLLGAKYRETHLANEWGLDEISPTLEFSKEWRFDEQSHAFYIVPSTTARPNRHNVLASLTVTVDDSWKFGGGYNRNLQERDTASSAFIRYNYSDDLFFQLSGYEYHGRHDTAFGRFSRQDNIEFKVDYSF